jgi:hypothetical protein
MFIIGINIGIALLSALVIFSLFAKKSFSLGRWYERGTQPFKYWETIIAYLIILSALWFGRTALLEAI